MTELLLAGSAETFKGLVHLALFGLCCVCLFYNLGVVLSRPATLNVICVVVYTFMVVFEAVMVHLHWSC